MAAARGIFLAGVRVRLYVGVTDGDWFEFLSSRPNVDEVNFWQPSPQNLPRLALGDLFLFKLKSPHNAIAGGGYFLRGLQMPVSYAWEAYAEKNGAATLQDLRTRLVRLRHSASIERGDFKIGCLLLTQPFFLERSQWIPQPSTWSANIVRGQYYEIGCPEGKYLFDAVSRTQTDRMLEQVVAADAPRTETEEPRRVWALLRPGQGYFRSTVASAYNWRCAVTQERVLPALEAAHIQPYSEKGPNEVRNGLMLRADIHNLLDQFYVTVSPDSRFEVGKKVKEDFENGRDYYKLHGQKLFLPGAESERPGREFLDWHNGKFRG
jgi:putative restriction endonuclease